MARRTGMGLGALLLFVYCAIAVSYTATDQYVDYAEPTIAAVGWLYHVGRPVYHAFDSPERYAHMYGPMAFMIPGGVLGLLGPDIATSKVAGTAAGLLGLVLAFCLARAAGTRRDALLLTGLFALMCLMFRHLSFWIRPDSFQLFFASAGLLAATGSRRLFAGVGLGAAAGILINLRITGLLYVLPAFALVAARFGVRVFALAALCSMVVAALPFVLFENVSLGNYLLWVGISARNGLQFWTLRQNIEWAVFLLVPLAPLLLTGPPAALPARTFKWVIGGLVVGLAGVVISASKPGAGAYHLMPFLPVVLYLIALPRQAVADGRGRQAILRNGGIAFLVTCALVAFSQQTYFLSRLTFFEEISAAEDVRHFARQHPTGSIAVGYSKGGERLSLVRPLLVFRDNAYLLDAPAIQEYQMSGVDLPPATLLSLTQCRVGTWLIPRDGEPFGSINTYPSTGHVPLFSEHFRRTFLATYEHTGDTRYYQVWRCRTADAR